MTVTDDGGAAVSGGVYTIPLGLVVVGLGLFLLLRPGTW